MNCLLLHDADPRYEAALSEHDMKYYPVPVLQITTLPPTTSSCDDCVIDSTHDGVMDNTHDGVIVTSKYAVNYIVENGVDLTGKCVAAVGPNTANLVQDYCERFEGVDLIWADNAAQLSNLILKTSPAHLKWVFYCGNKSLDIIPRTLQEHGVKLTQVVVYKTEKKGGFETDLLNILDSGVKFGAVVFFSPSGVEFASPVLSDRLSRDIPLVAFGRSTETVITSSFSDEYSIRTCKHPTPYGLSNVLLEIAADAGYREVL